MRAAFDLFCMSSGTELFWDPMENMKRSTCIYTVHAIFKMLQRVRIESKIIHFSADLI